MSRPRPRRILRWLSATVLALLLALHVLAVPFYAGSTLPVGLSWRFEHARLRVERRPQGTRESFYIALNSEGLRFGPQWRLHSWHSWMINIPLWMLIAPSLGLTIWSWMPVRDRSPGRCPGCGYSLSGLGTGAPCPECGRAPPGVTSPPP